MLGIILTGHGNFATGMESSIQLIVGKTDKLVAVDFKPGDSDVVLKRNLNEALEQLDSCSHIVILTDLMGGTPFKTSVMLSMEHKNCTVIYGTNLPMTLEFCMSVDSTDDIGGLVDKIIRTGKNQIDKFVLNINEDCNYEYEEGI